MERQSEAESVWDVGGVIGSGLSGEVRVATRRGETTQVNLFPFLFLFLFLFLSFSFFLVFSFSFFSFSLSLQFAMKVVDFPTLVATFKDFRVSEETLKANLLKEIEVMRRLRHRNIIYLEESFWMDTRLYICMELVEGKDLLGLIPRGGLKEDVAKDLFFQLCSAVSYCHANNVCDKIFLLSPFSFFFFFLFLLKISPKSLPGYSRGFEAREHFGA